MARTRTRAAAKPERRSGVGPAQSPIGVFLDPNSDEVTYFASEAEADAAIPESAIDEARAAAGSWADLDWDDMEAALSRIRRGGSATRPVRG